MILWKKTLFLLLIWVALDLAGGAILAWKITRTEAWVRTKDPVTHHGFRPMESQPEQYGPFRSMMHINSLGGKDASCREVPKVAVRPRVAVFGDSFAEGWGLPYEQTLPAHLQADLEAKGIEVLGFGVASFSPSLTEKWVRKLISQGVRWDLAVVLIDAGDYWEETHDYQDFIHGRKQVKVSNKPRFFRLKWYEYSLTVQAGMALHRSLFSKKETRTDWEMAREGNNWKLLWLKKPEAKNWLWQGLQQSQKAIERILAMGRENGFTVILAVYPYPVMMAEDRLENEHTLFWKEFSAQKGVPLIDLSASFLEPNQSPKTTYGKYFIPGDFHWNNVGNQLVARQLVPVILKKMASAEGFKPVK